MVLSPKQDKKKVHGEFVSGYHLIHDHLAAPEDSTGQDEIIAQIRGRDRRCCITGELISENNANGFEVTYIWPSVEVEFRIDVST